MCLIESSGIRAEQCGEREVSRSNLRSPEGGGGGIRVRAGDSREGHGPSSRHEQRAAGPADSRCVPLSQPRSAKSGWQRRHQRNWQKLHIGLPCPRAAVPDTTGRGGARFPLERCSTAGLRETGAFLERGCEELAHRRGWGPRVCVRGLREGRGGQSAGIRV